RGHTVVVETRAGIASGYPDAAYQAVGAIIAPSEEKLYGQAEWVVKIREPKPIEFELIQPHHTVFSFFQFFANLDMTSSMLARGCTCLAYEYLMDEDGRRPFLSLEHRLEAEVAIAQASFYLMTAHGGKGRLLGNIPGAVPCRVTVVGENDAACHAANLALKRGARVRLLYLDEEALNNSETPLDEGVERAPAGEDAYREFFPGTDLLISANTTPTGKTELAIPFEAVEYLKSGTVAVDLDIAMGGSIGTSHRTDHDNPIFLSDNGVIHYCVPHLAGVIPATSSEALSYALLPFLLRIADFGFANVLRDQPGLTNGLVIFEGRITKPELANELGVSIFNIRDTGDSVSNG
nr:hypothetical protein [Calditrichia bacterium]